MSTLAIRLLVLGNTLLLILPHGWCMALTFRPAQKSTPVKVSCCSVCHKPSRSKAPVPKPIPSAPFQHCCCRTEVTAPPRVEAHGPDLVLAEALPVTQNPASRQVDGSFGFAYFNETISLHVLNCLWLC